MSGITREAATASRTQAGKYLIFNLGGESYGVDVLQVREIVRLVGITAVPQMPAHFCGVINLRGKIIPVMSLRARLGVLDVQRTELTCIVVVQVKFADGRSLQMGLVVDAVEEVLNLSAQDIEEAPDFGVGLDTRFLLGMAKTNGVVKSLLDVNQIVGASDVPEFVGKVPFPA